MTIEIQQPKKAGRPSEFTDEIFTEICERMEQGKTLREICRDPDMPSRTTILRWVKNDDGRKRQYEFARQAQCDFWADEIVELSRDRSNDTIIDKDGRASANHAAVQRDRLICDNYKFLMGKLHPGRYGDKHQIELPAADKAEVVYRWESSERVMVAPIRDADGNLIDTDGALRARIRELEEQLGLDPKERKLITFDPGPLPKRLNDEIRTRLARLIMDNVPDADNRSPESVFDEVLSECERAMKAKYGTDTAA